MKSGANFIDQRKIHTMYAEGRTAEEISEKLMISLSHIKTYKPKQTRKKKGA